MGQGQQLPGAPAYKGRQDGTGVIGSMVLVNSDPHKWNNFSENHPQFSHATSQISPELSFAGKFQEYLFKGAQIVNVLGSPTFLMPALCAALELRRI